MDLFCFYMRLESSASRNKIILFGINEYRDCWRPRRFPGTFFLVKGEIIFRSKTPHYVTPTMPSQYRHIRLRRILRGAEYLSPIFAVC